MAGARNDYSYLHSYTPFGTILSWISLVCCCFDCQYVYASGLGKSSENTSITKGFHCGSCDSGHSYNIPCFCLLGYPDDAANHTSPASHCIRFNLAISSRKTPLTDRLAIRLYVMGGLSLTKEESPNHLPTPALIGWLLVSLFIPFAVFFWTIVGNSSTAGNLVYALLWAYIPEGANNSIPGTSIFGVSIPVDTNSIFYGFHIVDPMVLQWIPLFGIFNVIFIVQIIRYTREKSSFRSTLIVGLLTLAIPLFQTITYWQRLITIDQYYYFGPIPIQLIVGLLIMRFYGPKPIDRPWDEPTI